MNLNPSGTPYPYPSGSWNTTSTDSYPSELRGVVYITGSSSLQGITSTGAIIVAGAATFSGGASNTLNSDATLLTSPPPGFYTVQMMLQSGSWQPLTNKLHVPRGYNTRMIDHAPMPREQFHDALRAVGVDRYHNKHPFHVAMNAGELSAEQLRGWVANRFYYQRNIPLKDAAIISNCPLRGVRRMWIRRIHDHDGDASSEGGIEAWLRLAEACGAPRGEVLDERHVLPGVRFAVDAYVTLARTAPWPVAIASSLTELFAPDLMSERLAAFEKHYPFIAGSGLDYFRSRITRARKDSEEGLQLTLEYCNTRDLQQRALAALSTKCDILWSMLDAIMLAYGPDRSRYE
jgi:pyrroloquinoline-quinone synthase